MATATLNSTLEFPQYSKQPTSNFSISLTNCASVCLNLADTRHSSSGAEWFGNHALYWLAQMPLIASLLYACADLPDSSILLLRLKHLEAQNVGRYVRSIDTQCEPRTLRRRSTCAGLLQGFHRSFLCDPRHETVHHRLHCRFSGVHRRTLGEAIRI